jgi:hypothetical protein
VSPVAQPGCGARGRLVGDATSAVLAGFVRGWCRTGYVIGMPTDHDDAGAPGPRVDDWDDEPDPGSDEELTGDIGSILAGVTVVPAAIGWWRMRRGRRADQQATASTERIRPPRWFEL